MAYFNCIEYLGKIIVKAKFHKVILLEIWLKREAIHCSEHFEWIINDIEMENNVGFILCNHQLLLSKLTRYGFSGLPLTLINSYLKSRTQCVHLVG